MNNILFLNNVNAERLTPLLENNQTKRQTGTTAAAAAATTIELQVREIIDKKRKVVRNNSARKNAVLLQPMKMTAVDCMDVNECFCLSNNNEIQSNQSLSSSSTSSSSSGWEGSAVLSHGSLLRFGCVSFVFSIVECNNSIIDM